jgi:hypothetical protein
MDKKEDSNEPARTATTPADAASAQKLPEVDPRTGMLKVPPSAPTESNSEHEGQTHSTK